MPRPNTQNKTLAAPNRHDRQKKHSPLPTERPDTKDAAHPDQGAAPKPSLADRCIQISLLLAIGLTPLIFSQRATELFEFPKMAFIYVLACVTLTALGARWLQSRNVTVSFNLGISFALIFLAWLLITSLTSMNLYTSIAGYYTRFNGGLASYIAFSVLGYALLDQLSHKNRYGISPFLHQFLWTWLISATIVAGWGILEHFGHDPSCLILQQTFTADCWVEDVQARVFATFGQPNWLAMYLVATISVGLSFLLTSPPRRKILISLSVLLAYAAFWYTYSRSGWVGLLAALSTIALFTPWQRLWQQRWWLTIIIAGCAAISLSSFNPAALRAETSLSGRGADTSTGSIRLLVWQGTGQIIAHHPLIGTGPGTFAYSFLPYRPTAMNNTTEWNFLYNEAHNQTLNQAATTGIPGLLIWLTLCLSPLLLLWQGSPLAASWSKIATNLKIKPPSKALHLLQPYTALYAPTESNLRLLHVGLLAAIIGMFAGQLFGFAVVMTNLILFLALAIIFTPLTSRQSFTLSDRNFVSLALIIVISIVLAWSATGRYIMAELQVKQGDATSPLFQSTAINHYQQAVNLNPWEPNYRIKLAAANINAAASSNNAKSYIQKADAQLAAALNQNPYDLIIAKSAAYYYRHLATLEPSFQTDALQAAVRAANLAPTDADARRTLADMQQAFGHSDKALDSFNQLIKLRPHAADSFIQRAEFYQQQKKTDAMIQDAKAALRLDPSNSKAKQLLSSEE
jgi:O-antigen ligase